MSRIVLIADELNSVSLGFAKSLLQQSHDILLLSSVRKTFDQVPEFPILTPFNRWSLFEGARVLPQLAHWNPDVWHFLFTTDRSQPRPAHWLLAAFANTQLEKTLVASFFSNNQLKSTVDLAFLRWFDLRTFGTRSHLMRVKRRLALPAKSLDEVLPPIEEVKTRDALRIRPEIERLTETLTPYILIPDPPPSGLMPQWLHSRGYEGLLLSDRFKSRSPFFHSGPTSAMEREFLLKKSRAFYLADSDLSVIELRRFHELAETTKTPLIVSRYQNEILPGLCWHQKSGWVLESGSKSFLSLLNENVQLRLPEGFVGLSRHELTDSTLNELTRLYGRAYQLRWQ